MTMSNFSSPDAFLKIIQSRTARVAIGASAVRGRGNAGVLDAARSSLRALDLRAFGTSREREFNARLEEATENLRRSLPRAARHWGIARKVLNLFLAHALYTTYLSEAFDLRQAENFFEIPLDSITGKKLIELAGSGRLPRWPGVKHLKPAVSAQFQLVAVEQAKAQGVARVHLDALWWAVERDDVVMI